MPDKEPQVTFTDRRKISSDGEIRPEAAAQSAAEHKEMERREAEQREASAAQKNAAVADRPSASSAAAAASKQNLETSANAASARSQEQEEAMPPGPTAQETAESSAAYRQTTQQLDELMRAKSPESAHLGPVSFEHLVQSMYMSAMMALGAGTQPGEKPRIDLMAARQTIDLLSVLSEKTQSNLSEPESRLLDSAIFELRMMFLEITNAIARNASNPGPQAAPPLKRK